MFSARQYLVWVRPKEITKQSLIRDIGGSHNSPDLFHRLKIRTQSTMATENFFVDNGRYW